MAAERASSKRGVLPAGSKQRKCARVAFACPRQHSPECPSIGLECFFCGHIGGQLTIIDRMPASRLPVSLKSLAKLLRSSEISSHALTATAIEAAKASPYGCFSEICQDVAQSAADAADKRLASGTSLGLLDGVPFAIKDNFCTEFGKTTARRSLPPSRNPPLVDWPHLFALCLS